MLIAERFNGAVITVEHIIMLVVGGLGASMLHLELQSLRREFSRRLDAMEDKVGELDDPADPLGAVDPTTE